MSILNEDQIEQYMLDIFRKLGWKVKHGAEISNDADPYAPLPEGSVSTRELDFVDMILFSRLKQKIATENIIRKLNDLATCL
jgi:hypothetical protein